MTPGEFALRLLALEERLRAISVELLELGQAATNWNLGDLDQPVRPEDFWGR